MVKLIAMYRTPADAEEFDKHYFEVHMPLIYKMPGLLKTEVSRLSGMPGQDTKYHIMAEMYFESMDKLNESLASAEGKAAGKDLMSFAKDYVIMMFGEVKD